MENQEKPESPKFSQACVYKYLCWVVGILLVSTLLFNTRYFPLDAVLERVPQRKFLRATRDVRVFKRNPTPDVQQQLRPKVALMFLANSQLHNEPVWRAFMEAAGRLEPKFDSLPTKKVNLTKLIDGPLKYHIEPLKEEEYATVRLQEMAFYPKRKLNGDELASQDDGCQAEADKIDGEMERLLSGSPLSGQSIMASQSLFSVYTHVQVSNPTPIESLFYGTEIANPANTTGGFSQFVLVEAAILMMKEALKDPRNHRFALLSEGCIPLHSPDVMYLQLMTETWSRVNACENEESEGYRRSYELESPYLKPADWRKSPQWFVLNRDHAELTLADTHVRELFKRHCYTGEGRVCVPDEHYLPTLLASYGLDNQTDCLGGGTSIEWQGGWHPKTYGSEEIGVDLLKRLQKVEHSECDVEAARRSTNLLFDGLHDGCLERDVKAEGKRGAEEGFNNQTLSMGFKHLGYSCPIFARKFPPAGVNSTLRAALSCGGGAFGYWC